MGAQQEGTLRKVKKSKTTTQSLFDLLKANHNGSNSHSDGPRIDQKGASKEKTRVRKKRRPVAKISAKFAICEGKLVLDLPIQTKSEANCFEPWQVKHGRHKQQQKIVAYALNPHRDKIKLPCKIMLTRFAPDSLDAFDNLPMSFKYIVDAICAIITGEYRAGKADSDDRISIACDQVKSDAYGIRIVVSW
jgi:hypothetical protein